MMAPITRTPKLWLIRLTGASLLVLALLMGLAGYQHAFAADGDDNNNEEVMYGSNACTPTADLPAYANATCIKHKTEQNEEGTTTKNEYDTPDAGDTVRHAYEAAFSPNGWTLV